MARPKGTPNKIGVRAKDNICTVFDRLGGPEGMVEWALENKTEFYKMYAKLIPSEMTVTPTQDTIEEYVNSLSADEFREFAEGIKRIAVSSGNTKEGTAAETTDGLNQVH